MTQDDAFKILTMGKNVFLTGAAGSGKTYLINKYIEWLRVRGIDPAITASTGIAATHIGGKTIHSWSGIGIKKNLSQYDLDYIGQNERLVKQFRKTQILIIDEISMLSAQTLTIVNQAIQAGLQTHEPFGGLQVIFCGDFFQLPPITRGNEQTVFAFQSNVWKELSLHTCYLTDQYRQNDDNLLEILNGIREGNVSKELRTLLNERISLEIPEDVPHLYTHNANVDELNNEKLSLLSEYPHIFHMTTKGTKARIKTIMKGLLVPEALTLKKGAVVMFVKNHPQGDYVNGTLGVVVDFESKNPIVKTHDGFKIEVEPESWSMVDGDKVLAEVTQIPLRLAWAVTVHKSQGLTLDAAYIDLSKTFVPGQGYVALSRLKSLDGIFLKGISELAYSRHDDVADANHVFHNISTRLEKRLEKTDDKRIEEVSTKFIFGIGGHEPDPNRSKKKITKAIKLSTYDKTKELLKNEIALDKIVEKRGLTKDTILSHIEKLLTKHAVTHDDILYIKNDTDIPEDKYEKIALAFAKKETWNLTPVKEELKNKYSYEELRFARLFLRPWGNE